MAKYSKALVDKLVALIEEDVYTTSEVCRILAISRETYYDWKATKPEFAQAIEQAMEQREEMMRMKARQAMRKKLENHRQVTTKTTYVASKSDPSQLVVKEYVVKEKYCVPETSAVVFALSEKKNEGKRGRKRAGEATQSSFSPFSIEVNEEKIKHDISLLTEGFKGTESRDMSLKPNSRVAV